MGGKRAGGLPHTAPMVKTWLVHTVPFIKTWLVHKLLGHPVADLTYVPPSRFQPLFNWFYCSCGSAIDADVLTETEKAYLRSQYGAGITDSPSADPIPQSERRKGAQRGGEGTINSR